MATLEDSNLTQSLDEVRDAVNSTTLATSLVGSSIDIASLHNRNGISELKSVLFDIELEMIQSRRDALLQNARENTDNYGSTTLSQIEVNTKLACSTGWSVEDLLRMHFEEMAAREEESRDAQEKSDEEAKDILANLSGSLQDYFEEQGDADEEDEDKGIIGGMIGGIKGFFGGMFSSGLGKLFKGVQVSITKTSIKDFVGGFKPLIAAAGIGGGGKKSGGFKNAVGNKVGQAAGKGIGSIISAIANSITKIGNAIVRFINLMSAGIPLIPPLLIAALVIVIGLYFVVDLIITTFYPLFEMLTNAVCDFFPQVIGAIMAASPLGALVLIVKSICKLIAAMSGVDMDNPNAKRDVDLPYEKVLDSIHNVLETMLTFITSRRIFKSSEKNERQTLIGRNEAINTVANTSNTNTRQTFNSVSDTVSKATNSNIENSTMATSETTFNNSFSDMTSKLLAPITDIYNLLDKYIAQISEYEENKPISQSSNSSIQMQNLNNTSMVNNIAAADGVIPGGNSIGYSSFTNNTYTDLNAGGFDNSDVVNKLSEILNFLKQDSINRYGYNESSNSPAGG